MLQASARCKPIGAGGTSRCGDWSLRRRETAAAAGGAFSRAFFSLVTKGESGLHNLAEAGLAVTEEQQLNSCFPVMHTPRSHCSRSKIERRGLHAALMRAVSAFGTLMLMTQIIPAASVTGDEMAVAAFDTEYQEAMKNNDVATMARILADDFVLVTGFGKVFTKADLLEEARSKRTTYEHQEDSQQKVRVWGDTAVVTALLWVKGNADGKPFDYKLRFSDTYVRTPSGWRYAFAQASTHLL